MPTTRNRRMDGYPIALMSRRVSSTAGNSDKMGTMCFSCSRPRKRSAKPMMNSPQAFLRLLPELKNGKARAMSGKTRMAMLNLNPKTAMIHVVTVVPTLAPMMTDMDCASEIMPALANETIINVVADDDWTRAVTRMPTSMPVKRLLFIAASTLRRLSPAIFCSPSLISFSP